VGLGATATVGIVAMGVQDLTTVTMDHTNEPTVVVPVEFGPGSLFTNDGAAVGAERGHETGRVRADFRRATGTAGSGVVASVTFRGLRAGTSPLRMDNLELTTGGRSIRAAANAAMISVSE
jgi:hypothetical protein